MVRKKKYDDARQEVEPPRVPEPYSVRRTIEEERSVYVLERDGVVIKRLLSQSEDGAHRESMMVLKELDF